jgi:hypothetical protein
VSKVFKIGSIGKKKMKLGIFEVTCVANILEQFFERLEAQVDYPDLLLPRVRVGPSRSRIDHLLHLCN